MSRWFFVLSHVVVVALFLGAAFMHVLGITYMRWETVFLVTAASVPFLLPLLSAYVKGIGKDGITFQPIIPSELKSLPQANQSRPAWSEGTKSAIAAQNWTRSREEEYSRVQGYMLGHVYKRSTKRNQEFSVFIFLVRHKKGTSSPPQKHFDEIEKLEFFFGDSWSNQVFTVQNSGGVLGVRTEAWGTFLATCRVTFKESSSEPIVIHRYVDFHMLQSEIGDA